MSEQVIQMTREGSAIALVDYKSRELDVCKGDVLQSTKQLKGWIWCILVSNCETG